MVYDKVLNYCKKNNLSVCKFEKQCGLSNGTVRNWVNGSKPSVDSLIKISKETRIPMEKWL